MSTPSIPEDVLDALTADQRHRLLVAVTVREVAAFTQGSGLLARPVDDAVPVLYVDSLPDTLIPAVADDPAPVMLRAPRPMSRAGFVTVVALGAAFWLGVAWPFGSWVAAGAW